MAPFSVALCTCCLLVGSLALKDQATTEAERSLVTALDRASEMLEGIDETLSRTEEKVERAQAKVDSMPVWKQVAWWKKTNETLAPALRHVDTAVVNIEDAAAKMSSRWISQKMSTLAARASPQGPADKVLRSSKEIHDLMTLARVARGAPPPSAPKPHPKMLTPRRVLQAVDMVQDGPKLVQREALEVVTKEFAQTLKDKIEDTDAKLWKDKSQLELWSEHIPESALADTAQQLVDDTSEVSKDFLYSIANSIERTPYETEKRFHEALSPEKVKATAEMGKLKLRQAKHAAKDFVHEAKHAAKEVVVAPVKDAKAKVKEMVDKAAEPARAAKAAVTNFMDKAMVDVYLAKKSISAAKTMAKDYLTQELI